MYKALLLLGVVYLTKGAPPSFLTKCKSDDSKCARDTAEKVIPIFAAGLPEYGVEPLDPVVFDSIDASTPSLKFLIKDATVTGLGNCEALKIQRDVTKSKMFLRFLCTTEFEGQYELEGQVLVLKVEGKGKIHASLSRAARELIDKNGNDIIKEIGSPVIKAVATKVVKTINHFFKAIPAEDLSID